MKVVFFACSKRGYRLAEQVRGLWQGESPEDEIRIVVKYESADRDLSDDSLKVCGPAETIGLETGEAFENADALIYFCAAGIAVRSIAPYLSHKSKDPAVLCMDESGKYCISLLSGHLGGANLLCNRISGMTGALPVITTASDNAGTFSPDLFAKEHGLILKDYPMAKTLAAAALSGEKIGIVDTCGKLSREPLQGTYGILIEDMKTEAPFENTLVLYRRDLILGIGCKKGTDKDVIEAALTQFLNENRIDPECIKAVVSIDLKAEEPGILSLCEERGLNFITFSGEDMKAVEEKYGASFFTRSEFVEAVTGALCVCEESIMAAGAKELLIKKTKYPQVTLSLGR